MLKIKDLSLSLSGRKILNNINFSVKENTSLIVSGPNGSGKTKLLEILAGFENNYNGEIHLQEKPLGNYDSELYNILGYLGNFGFVNNLSENIISDLAFPLEIQNTPKEIIKEKLDTIIKDFNLERLLHTEPINLSSGEKQLVNLCSLIIKDPKIVILDYPMTMIDNTMRNLLLDKLIRSKKYTVVMVSNEISQYSDFDNILFLDKGEISYFGDTETFIDNYNKKLS